MKSAKKLPRGIRNNNPLNIRVGNKWIGEVEKPTDMSFEQFTEMKYGCRAAFILFKRYINRYKCNTISKLIQRWAPNNENNTAYYIKVVWQRTGFAPDMELKFENTCQMACLFQAMCFVENGREIDWEPILEGYSLAKV